MLSVAMYQPNFTHEVERVSHEQCVTLNRTVDDRPEVFATASTERGIVWLRLKVFALTPSARLTESPLVGRLVVGVDKGPKIILAHFSDKGMEFAFGLSGLKPGVHRILYFLETGIGIPSYGQICLHV